MLARAAAEDLAPSISSSCLLCYKLARSLHAQVMQDIESATTGKLPRLSCQLILLHQLCRLLAAWSWVVLYCN